jgi:hypothetical protein
VAACTSGPAVQYGIFIEIQEITTEPVGTTGVGLCNRDTLADVFGNMLTRFEIPSSKETVST